MLPNGRNTFRWVALLWVAAALACARTGRAPLSQVPDAQSRLARGDTAGAAALLEAGDATDPAAARMLGRMYRERGTIQGRLLSQRLLESARARHPDDVDLTVELATTYFAQGFYPDAVRIFRDVLARDPARCDARRMLALYHYNNWKRMNEYTDDLAAARRELRAALRCDPGDAGVALRALVAGYALGDSIAGECEELVERFPARPEFRMMRGSLAFEAGRFDLCARDFAQALPLMDVATREAYQSLVHVLAASDDARYRSAAAPARNHFQRGWWLSVDPDPTTDVNPRALEHAYRLFLTDCLFSSETTGRRGWETDRGEAFIRFGRPVDVAYTMGAVANSGKVETWSFLTGGVFHQLVFVDEFLNGNPRIPYAADITLHFMRHTPAVTALAPDAVPIPAMVDAYAFRDDGTTSSIYVAMAIDGDALREHVDVSKVNRFVVRGNYFDEQWVREGGFSDSVRVDGVHEARSSRGRAFELVRRLRVPCDRYHVAVAFEDEFSVARAVGRRDADALRFASDLLSLSDVLLFREPAAAGGDVVIERGGARMSPMLGNEFGPGERLRAYVEIYNLAMATQGAVRTSSYDLRFAIFPARGDPDPAWIDWARGAAKLVGFGDDEAVISQTFRREGRAHDDVESITIDVDVLEAGRYELLVEVRDRRSGRSAGARAGFGKLTGPLAEKER